MGLSMSQVTLKEIDVSAVSGLLQLGEPRDEYERQHIAMCENDLSNAKLVQLTIKHLTARRQKVQQ